MTRGEQKRAKGFSAVEMVTVVALVALLAAIATPPLMHWRKEISSGRGVRSAYDALRQARSRAISTNYQQMVSFDPAQCRYRVLKGSQGYHTPSTGWGSVVKEWVALTDGVTMTTGTGGSLDTVNVQFNADGTARLERPAGTALAPPATVTVSVKGDAEARNNKVVVSTCGRISLE